MFRNIKVAAVSAAALLLAAVPAFAYGSGNFAVVKGNDVSVGANTGGNTQTQLGFWSRSQRQTINTGDATAGGNQALVVNSNACGCQGSSKNFAVVKNNDVTVVADTGENTQTQVGGKRQNQTINTGNATAGGNQWVVVNSKGSL